MDMFGCKEARWLLISRIITVAMIDIDHGDHHYPVIFALIKRYQINTVIEFAATGLPRWHPLFTYEWFTVIKPLLRVLIFN